MRPNSRLMRWIKNPYLLSSVAFIAWMVWGDAENVVAQHALGKQIKKLQAEKAYYLAQIGIIKKNHQALMSDEALLEKFAREKYFMKKPTEDVYVIEEN
jgi:cell division protein FtsB